MTDYSLCVPEYSHNFFFYQMLGYASFTFDFSSSSSYISSFYFLWICILSVFLNSFPEHSSNVLFPLVSVVVYHLVKLNESNSSLMSIFLSVSKLSYSPTDLKNPSINFICVVCQFSQASVFSFHTYNIVRSL